MSEFTAEYFDPKITVWLVDDDETFRSMLVQSLRRQRGIECAKDFSSPDAALSALASQIGPDVILLDIHMRDRNGLDAIGPIKCLSRATQVLMLTTFYDPEGHKRALASGASDFLLKNFPLDEMVRRIRNPKKFVMARRRRVQKTSCPSQDSRSQAKFTRGSKSVLHRSLKFVRSLIH